MATRPQQDEVKMDMTPMIDCIFQLIIFFFLIIDLQNQELEALVLPKSDFQTPDEPPPGFRPILNILQDGRIVYKQQTYHDPKVHKDNYTKLHKLLATWVKDYMVKKMDPVLKVKLPDDPLLIRADIWTEMHHIAKVMELCGAKDVQIWRVQLAVGEPKQGSAAAAAQSAK